MSTIDTGPITATRKETVSRNALKHGLTGNTHAALPGEESAFEKHVQGYRQSLRPIGPHEEDLVRAIAANFWRLHRAHSMESELFERTMDECNAEGTYLTAAWMDPNKGLQRVALYAARIQRAIEKLTAKLDELQNARRDAYQKAQDEAVQLTILAATRREKFDPAGLWDNPEEHGGFVYSAKVIDHLAAKLVRLRDAKELMQTR